MTTFAATRHIPSAQNIYKNAFAAEPQSQAHFFVYLELWKRENMAANVILPSHAGGATSSPLKSKIKSLSNRQSLFYCSILFGPHALLRAATGGRQPNQHNRKYVG